MVQQAALLRSPAAERARPGARGSPAHDRARSGVPPPPALEVELKPPTVAVVSVPAWDKLARQQPDVDEELLQRSATGDVFALDDRNVTSMPWRHVYAVRDGKDFVLYDSKGDLIDEPKDGLPNGRQTVDELVDEFSVNGFYYRPGKTRQAPMSERLSSPTPHGDQNASSSIDDAGMDNAKDDASADPATTGACADLPATSKASHARDAGEPSVLRSLCTDAAPAQTVGGEATATSCIIGSGGIADEVAPDMADTLHLEEERGASVAPASAAPSNAVATASEDPQEFATASQEPPVDTTAKERTACGKSEASPRI